MNVVRTFFENNSNLPSFELENGEIKNPSFDIKGNRVWLTDNQISDEHKTLVKTLNFLNSISSAANDYLLSDKSIKLPIEK